MSRHRDIWWVARNCGLYLLVPSGTAGETGQKFIQKIDLCYNLYVKKILITNYDQGFYDYNSSRGSGHTRSIKRTIMTYMEEFSEKWIVYQLKHFDYISNNERRFWYSYYFFDTENQQIYKLGEDDKNNRSIFVAEHGLMINQEGELIWVTDN